MYYWAKQIYYDILYIYYDSGLNLSKSKCTTNIKKQRQMFLTQKKLLRMHFALKFKLLVFLSLFKNKFNSLYNYLKCILK